LNRTSELWNAAGAVAWRRISELSTDFAQPWVSRTWFFKEGRTSNAVMDGECPPIDDGVGCRRKHGTHRQLVLDLGNVFVLCRWWSCTAGGLWSRTFRNPCESDHSLHLILSVMVFFSSAIDEHHKITYTGFPQHGTSPNKLELQWIVFKILSLPGFLNFIWLNQD